MTAFGTLVPAGVPRPGSRIRRVLHWLGIGSESRFPWARPRFELALLAIVAVAALTPLTPPNPQDMSRICLAEAMLHGRLSNDPCLASSVDFASYQGKLYSDKAPGLSILELPAVAVLQPGLAGRWGSRDLSLWGVRAASVGVCLILLAFLLGRVSEGLAPGFGGITLVTFALGTLVAALVSVSFEHVPAAVCVFGVFLLAWRRRPLLAGLLGGAALLVEYDSALILAAIGLYVLLGGWRRLGLYLAGIVPGALLLGAYDWAAFGAPWHLSYRYVSAAFSADQSKGFFGISMPTLAGLYDVLSGNGGLLFVSPVLALAAVGLVRLGARFRPEAILAGGVFLLMLLVNAGYYLPYGGTSPGPRFLVSGLPFLAIGLAPAFSWRPRLTLALAAVSVATATAIELTWSTFSVMRGTVWSELARIPFEGSSSVFVANLLPNVASVVGVGRDTGALLVGAAAAIAFLLAASTTPWPAVSRRLLHPRRSRLLAVASCVALVLVAVDAGAIFAYPYGNGYQGRVSPLALRIAAVPPASYPGGEVNFAVSVVSQTSVTTLPDVVVTATLSPGMQLVGPPNYTIGDGCRGTQTIVCELNYLPPHTSTTVWFGVQLTAPVDGSLRVRVSSDGFPAPKSAFYLVRVGR